MRVDLQLLTPRLYVNIKYFVRAIWVQNTQIKLGWQNSPDERREEGEKRTNRVIT